VKASQVIHRTCSTNGIEKDGAVYPIPVSSIYELIDHVLDVTLQIVLQAWLDRNRASGLL
jgi:hypothetical protein